MKKRVVQLAVLIGLGALMMGTASASFLVSSQGFFGDQNAVFEQQFTYDPTMGNILTIQTYGYGGSSNAPGGRNAGGLVITAGGFDPMIALYSGMIGGGGARVAANDDGICGPGAGAVDPTTGNCYDSTLVFNNLASGTYTVALAAYPNAPPAFENSLYPGNGSFGNRTAAFAIDVVATPEPITSMLLGSGLLAVAFLTRRKRRS